MTQYNLPLKSIYTFPAHSGNAITKEYYNFLVGEINRGTILDKAVFKRECECHGAISYYLISTR